MDRKELESAGKIMAKSGIDGLRIVFGLQLSFIDANEFLSFPRFLTETVVGDAVKPGRKPGFSAKAAQVLVGLEKGLLRQIIGKGNIAPDQVTQQTSHTRLMIPDQLREGVVVVINNNSCNEVCIG